MFESSQMFSSAAVGEGRMPRGLGFFDQMPSINTVVERFPITLASPANCSDRSSQSGETEQEDALSSIFSTRQEEGDFHFTSRSRLETNSTSSAGLGEGSFFGFPMEKGLLIEESTDFGSSFFEKSRLSSSPMSRITSETVTPRNHQVGPKPPLDPQMQERLQMQMMLQRKAMQEQHLHQQTQFTSNLTQQIRATPSSNLMVPKPHDSSPPMNGRSLPSNGATAAYYQQLQHKAAEESSYALYLQQQQQQLTRASRSQQSTVSASRPMLPTELHGTLSTHSSQQQRAMPMHSQQHQLAYSPPSQVQQGNIGNMQGKIYQVQFKCSVRYFTLSPQVSQPVAAGDFVVVEADRGEDIGIVTEVMTMKSFVERRIKSKMPVDDDESTIGKIQRIAVMAERQILPEKFRNEENVLQMCRELAFNTYRLPMTIHNVEYQFDRHKLTVYYSAESRVDFREFVRDLFSAYKARIWMKKIDTSRPVEFDPNATMALATGMQFTGTGDRSPAAHAQHAPARHHQLPQPPSTYQSQQQLPSSYQHHQTVQIQQQRQQQQSSMYAPQPPKLHSQPMLQGQQYRPPAQVVPSMSSSNFRF